MKLIQALLGATQPEPRRRAIVDIPTTMPSVAAPGDDDPTGCGWFDSSWHLRAGLQITEHSQVDVVASDLPLAWWLEGPCAVPRNAQ